MQRFWLSIIVCLLVSACHSQSTTGAAANPNKAGGTLELSKSGLDQQYSQLGKAYFAGGCFWCTEAVFERVRGVAAVYSGYSGGQTLQPTYEEVGRGGTGHAEAIVVYYDTTVLSYEQLLVFFFASHDPTTLNRQGPDSGPEYRSAVFYLSEAQRLAASTYINQLNTSGKFLSRIVTEVSEAGPFYLAEDYHQDYYPQHPENPYVQRITRPKVEKFEKEFASWLKPQ